MRRLRIVEIGASFDFPSRAQHHILLGLRIQLVQLLLDAERQPDGRHHPAVGADVVEVETAVLAVFQPFVADLITADPVIVNLGRDGAEILSFVDVHALGISVIAEALGLRTGDNGIAVALEAAGWRVEFEGIEEVQDSQARTQGGDLGEYAAILRERNAREVGAQKVGVPSAIGWGIQESVDVVEDVLGRGCSVMRCRQGLDQLGIQVGLPC